MSVACNDAIGVTPRLKHRGTALTPFFMERVKVEAALQRRSKPPPELTEKLVLDDVMDVVGRVRKLINQ